MNPHICALLVTATLVFPLLLATSPDVRLPMTAPRPIETQTAHRPYLGQPLPRSVPQVFAPGLVNTGLSTRDITFLPDGTELYYRVATTGFTHCSLVGSRLTAQGWTKPEVPAFASDPRWKTLEPAIAPDGRRFYFVSDRPEDPKAKKPIPMGIWVMDREGDGWGTPRRLSADINRPDGSFRPSVTSSGTLYFHRDGADGLGSVWRARPKGDGFEPSGQLPLSVQLGEARYNPYVTPDERCMILSVTGLPDAVGGMDYIALFRNEKDQWSQPLNLGPVVNQPGNGEVSATLSPDGKFFFFATMIDTPGTFAPGERLTVQKLRALDGRPGVNGRMAIFWMEAGFLEELRKKAVFPK